MDLTNLKREVEQRAELEVSIKELQKQLPIQKQKCKQLKAHLDYAQAEIVKLEKNGVKGLLLQILGKREEALEEAQVSCRKIYSELQAAELQSASMQDQMQELRNEWKAKEALEEAYYSALEQHLQENSQAIPSTFLENRRKAQQLSQAAELLERMRAERNALEPLLTKVENAYWHGDIRTDLSGNRYNSRLGALKTALEPFLAAFPCLLRLIAEYNALVPPNLAVDLSDSWVVKQDYWDHPQMPEDLYQRFEPVQIWVKNQQYHWGNLEKELQRCWRSRQTALREQAWSIHVRLQEA